MKRHICGGLLLAAISFSISTLKADEFEALPQAPESASTPTPRTIAIKSVIPPYVDQGVMMLPMRPLCDFLGATTSYHDAILTIARSVPATGDTNSSLTTITLRTGGGSAQLQKGYQLKTVKMPLPADERLGTVFVPFRFITEALGAEVVQSSGVVAVKAGERTGVLQSSGPPPYRGGDAARVTIANYVGHALSIRLTGPQNLAVELGRKQSITRSLPPGVYYYRAASTGMKTVKGVRRLLAGRKATWSWGRRS